MARLNLATGVRPAPAPTTKPGGPASQNTVRPQPAGPSFADLLQERLAGVRFSQHARERLNTRDIELDEGQAVRLEGAVGALASKGGKTSLVMLDQLALVVSVPNRTVITALPASDQAVFTNIDSAIKA